MTKQVKIYHNPRCSKSRETLNLLKENGVEPEVVLYLQTPADAATGAGTGNRGLRCAPSLVEAHCRMRRLPRLIRPTNTMD